MEFPGFSQVLIDSYDELGIEPFISLEDSLLQCHPKKNITKNPVCEKYS